MPGSVPPWLRLSGRYQGNDNIELLKNALPNRSISKLRLEDFDGPINADFVEALRRLLHHRPIDSVTIQGGNFLPDDIGTTKHLILRNVEVRPNAALTLVRFNYLVSLSLISMSLSSPLVTVLAEMKQIQSLDLNDSRFVAAGDGVAILSQGLRNNKSLKTLCLSECNLMDGQINIIVQSLWDHPSIQELDISFNKCRSAGMKALSRLLLHSKSSPSPSKLIKLCMGFQAFGVAKQIDLQEFCTALASNSTLKELELGGNSLRNDDLEYLVQALCAPSSCCRLEVLDLSENRFTTLLPLARRLGDIKYLRQLSLEENRFDEESLDALIDALSLTPSSMPPSMSSENEESSSLSSSSLPPSSSLNVVLEDIELGEEMTEKYAEKWKQLAYYLDLNWGGRRLLAQDNENLPMSLWPLILARSNKQALNNTSSSTNNNNNNSSIMNSGFPSSSSLSSLETNQSSQNHRLTRSPVAHDIIYFCLQGFPSLTCMASTCTTTAAVTDITTTTNDKINENNDKAHQTSSIPSSSLPRVNAEDNNTVGEKHDQNQSNNKKMLLLAYCYSKYS